MNAKTVREIIKKALNGDLITREEIVRLFSVPLLSEESAEKPPEGLQRYTPRWV